jgi:hypothetical protein
MFSCAECGNVAAFFLASPEIPGSVLVTEFLGDTYNHTVGDPEAHAALCAVLESDQIDPLTLRSYHWLFGPFYCMACSLNYCTADWSPERVHGPGGYRHTLGTCPRGHAQKIHGWSTDPE